MNAVVFHDLSVGAEMNKNLTMRKGKRKRRKCIPDMVERPASLSNGNRSNPAGRAG